MATNKASGCLTYAQNFVNRSFERYFFWHGKFVATHPWWIIVFCCLLTAGLGVGVAWFKKEENPNKLWIEQDSALLKAFDWKQKNYPPDLRPHFILFEADNVLDKEKILAMYDTRQFIQTLDTDKKTYREMCMAMPSARLRLSAGGYFDWINIFDWKEDYCRILKNLDRTCYFEGLLEVWGADPEVVRKKTQKQILDDINNVERSAEFGRHLNLTDYLSGVKREGSRIVGAKATMHIFVNTIDREAVERGEVYKDDIGLDYVVDLNEHKWEGMYIEAMNKYKASNDSNIDFYFVTPSSLNRVSDKTIFGDANFLMFGFIVEFFYVSIMLGKFNAVEQRPVLALFGLLCVGFSIIVSYGICSMFEVKYSPVSTILPFLLLGLGIDGMFVIMQAWNNLSFAEKKEPLPERVGIALKHAGVSITIASITNFMAFLIGCTSVLPGLLSFCLYTAIGIFFVFFFQCTFYTAWFALDQRRMEKKKHCLFWCYKMKENWKPSKCSQHDLCQSFFENVLGKALVLKPVKAFVLLLTVAILAFGGWSMSHLRQELDLIWFVPNDNHMYRFHEKTNEHFSDRGERVEVLLGELDYFKEMGKILELGEKLKKNPYVSKIKSWAEEYKTFVEKEKDLMFLDPDADEDDFYLELGEFLFSDDGIYHKENSIKFANVTLLNCLDPAPPKIAGSRIELVYKLLHNSRERIDAMDSVRDIIQSMNFSSFSGAYSTAYMSWETDKVIEFELYRNLTLAMIIVFFITLILMASWRASFLVLTCVLFTMIDLLGFMQVWGLTIELTSATTLVLAVGLCVDYSAHVAHTFITQPGTKDERLKQTLANIGPAVFNGGVSTFLAFIFLSTSDSHIFKTFFRCFLSVTLLGLYHGLIFLPVVLSLVGPEPLIHDEPNYQHDVMDIEKLYKAHNGNSHVDNGNVPHDNNNRCSQKICRKQHVLYESNI